MDFWPKWIRELADQSRMASSGTYATRHSELWLDDGLDGFRIKHTLRVRELGRRQVVLSAVHNLQSQFATEEMVRRTTTVPVIQLAAGDNKKRAALAMSSALV